MPSLEISSTQTNYYAHFGWLVKLLTVYANLRIRIGMHLQAGRVLMLKFVHTCSRTQAVGHRQ